MLTRFCSGLLLILFSVVAAEDLSHGAESGRDSFPMFPEIRDNVEFWKKIYGKYNSRQWVLHDLEEMDIIYSVVDVPRGVCPYGAEGRRLAKRHKESLKGILLRLSEGQGPRNKEEQRIVSLVGPNASSSRMKKAAERVRVQLGQADRFREGVIRSGKYASMMEQEFRARGLPTELTYLPHVESSFDTHAYSKFGAAGMWQFMRSTGQQYMKVGQIIDERLDPVKATQAAAKLLAQNYRELGSWPLALTAYNHGVGGIKRAIRQTGTNHYGEIYRRHKHPSFGFASRNFYSEFLAAKHVARNYRQYFGNISLARPSPYVEVRLPLSLTVSKLTESIGVSRQDIQELNPAIRPVVFSSNHLLPSGFVLRLPQRGDANYRTLLASISEPGRPAAVVEPKKRAASVSGEFVRVSPGDTLIGISMRHGVKVADLKAVNGIKGDFIREGQSLRLPRGANRPAAPLKQEEKAGPKTTAATAVTTEKAAAHGTAGEKEKKVDSVSVASNALVDSKSPASSAPREMPVSSQAADPKRVGYAITEARGKNGTEVGIVRVQPGETLGHYADWLGTNSQSIRRFNGFSQGRHVRIGEEIKIPLAGGKKTEFEYRRSAYHSGIEEDFFAAYRVSDLVQHKVSQGDNIWRLCRETYETPFWLVAVYNKDKDLEALHVGETILIPVPVPVTVQ